MSQNRQLIRKLISLFTSLAISAGVLVGLSTSANAASMGTILDISPSATDNTFGTSVEITGSGNKNYFLRWQATGSGTLTVNPCTQDATDTITTSLTTTLLASNVPVTDDAAAGIQTVSSSSSTACADKGAETTYLVSSGKYYYIKLVVDDSANHKFSVKIKLLAGSGPTPTYMEVDRITICHRTHATTNPYRIITVSTSSIVAANGDIRGHAKHATDARRYDPSLYGTYDSTKSYRPNAKLWGDIIPPFKDKSNGAVFTGLNWSWNDPSDTDSNGIFSKSEFENLTTGSGNSVAQSAVDLCKGASGQLTSKQLFELERKNGQKRSDILDEIKDTDQYEPEVYKEKDALEKELPAKEGPKDVPTTGIDQSLAGKVWLDVNRNGFQEDNEPYMANIQVTVAQGNSPNAAGRFTGFGTGAKFFENEFGANFATQFFDSAFNKLSPVINGVRSIFGMAITYTVYTDKNGSYLFVSLPAGEWNVTGVVPAGLEVTYDSFASSDASVDATVPAGGFAFTWVGLVGPAGTGINAPILNPDGTPVTGQFVLTSSGNDAIFCNADDVNYLLTAIDGKLVLSGIPNGSYYIRQIGNTSTIADFNVVLGETYSGTISTVKGVRCSLLTGQQLAATGGSVDGISLAALIMLSLGTVATVIGVRRTRTHAE